MNFPRATAHVMAAGFVLWLSEAVCPSTSAQAQRTAAEAHSHAPASIFTAESGWKTLFDEKTLEGWTRTEFAGGGEVTVDPDFQGHAAIVIDMGVALSGLNRTNAPFTSNYELTFEGMKVEGHDFFCGVTFPVKDSFATWILGGWGGAVVGISSVDGADASENETTKYMRFDPGKWYRIDLRVTDGKIEGWIDREKLIDLDLEDRKISLRFGEIDLSKPLGFATYQTRTALRDLRIRSVAPAAGQ